MELPTRDEVVDAIKVYKEAIEADEWRPLAQYIVDLVKFYVEKNKEKNILDALVDWMEG